MQTGSNDGFTDDLTLIRIVSHPAYPGKLTIQAAIEGRKGISQQMVTLERAQEMHAALGRAITEVKVKVWRTRCIEKFGSAD